MSTEDKVRGALADLAPRVPAGDEALAGVHRAITRRRRRRTAVRAAVAAGLLVAVATAGVIALAGGEEGSELDMSENPSTTPTTESVAEIVDGRVEFGPLRLELPDRWTVIQALPSGDDSAWMCIAPAANPDPKLDNCAGLFVRYGSLPGRETFTYEETRGDWAWNHATDVVACPTTNDLNDQVVPGPEGTEPIAFDVAPVGDKTADYTQWAAYCSRSGFRFTPRMWVLPQSRIMIEDVLGRDETEDILASVEFTDE